MSGASLLVSGSRVITETAAATDWAIARLRHHVDAFSPTYVVHGGAAGVDTLADMLAAELGLVRVRYDLDGSVYRNDVRVKSWLLGTGEYDPKRYPLERNLAMVNAVRRVTAFPTMCLALVAPWSRTAGSKYTAGRAKAVGIATIVELCPAQHGPRGGTS